MQKETSAFAESPFGWNLSDFLKKEVDMITRQLSIRQILEIVKLLLEIIAALFDLIQSL